MKIINMQYTPINMIVVTTIYSAYLKPSNF